MHYVQLVHTISGKPLSKFLHELFQKRERECKSKVMGLSRKYKYHRKHRRIHERHKNALAFDQSIYDYGLKLHNMKETYFRRRHMAIF